MVGKDNEKERAKEEIEQLERRINYKKDKEAYIQTEEGNEEKHEETRKRRDKIKKRS